MGFEDIFLKQKHHGNYEQQKHEHNLMYSHDRDHGHKGNLQLSGILEKLRGNRSLRILVILGGIFTITIAIVLIVVFLPFIMKLIHYVGQNGLQGLVEYITVFLDKLWKGSAV